MLTREYVKSSLFVIRGISISGIAYNHTGLPNSTIPNQHTTDRVLQCVLLLQAHGRDSWLLVKVIHLRWHVQKVKAKMGASSEKLVKLHSKRSRLCWDWCVTHYFPNSRCCIRSLVIFDGTSAFWISWRCGEAWLCIATPTTVSRLNGKNTNPPDEPFCDR